MIERKLNLFGHICRMQDDRLINQPIFGIWTGQTRKEDPEEDGQTTWWTDATRISVRLYPLWIGVGQEEVESFRKVCREHQRALSPWSKEEEEEAVS